MPGVTDAPPEQTVTPAWLLKRIGIPLLVLIVLMISFLAYFQLVTLPAREKARTVMAHLMARSAPPTGWEMRENLSDQAKQYNDEYGPSKEAYIVYPTGYPWPMHIVWVGLSKRNEGWFLETVQCNVDAQSIQNYHVRKAEVNEATTLLSALDKLADQQKRSREDFNVIKRQSPARSDLRAPGAKN